MYFRPESVPLAIQLLDDTEFRLGGGQRMKVAEADFSYKAQKDAPKQSNMKTKKKIIKKTQKLNKYVDKYRNGAKPRSLTVISKLADWDDDDPQAVQDTSSRWDKVVILKHMFTLQELEVSQCLYPAPQFTPNHHYRKTQLLSLKSKKTFARNVPKWVRSRTSYSSTRRRKALQACATPMLKLLWHVYLYVTLLMKLTGYSVLCSASQSLLTAI